jgi:hypothetical protein
MRLNPKELRRELEAAMLRDLPLQSPANRQHIVDRVMRIVVRHVTAKRGRGRPSGTAKFEEFDIFILSLLENAVAGQTATFATALVRKEVQESWDRTNEEMRRLGTPKGVDPRHVIGKSVDAATARIMKRLRGAGAYDVLFPIAFPNAAKVRRRNAPEQL